MCISAPHRPAARVEIPPRGIPSDDGSLPDSNGHHSHAVLRPLIGDHVTALPQLGNSREPHQSGDEAIGVSTHPVKPSSRPRSHEAAAAHLPPTSHNSAPYSGQRPKWLTCPGRDAPKTSVARLASATCHSTSKTYWDRSSMKPSSNFQCPLPPGRPQRGPSMGERP